MKVLIILFIFLPYITALCLPLKRNWILSFFVVHMLAIASLYTVYGQILQNKPDLPNELMLYGLMMFCAWFYVLGGFIGIGIRRLNTKYDIPLKLRILNYIGGVGITAMLTVLIPRILS